MVQGKKEEVTPEHTAVARRGTERRSFVSGGRKSGVGKKRRIFLSADNDSFPFFPGAFCMGEFVCIFLLTLCILRQSGIDKT
jgi:hypothetical protein